MALSSETAFLLGALGAAAPEILRLYELRTKPDQFKWTWSYLGMTIPFLILGGLIAIVLPTTTFWGAFYAGLTMPVTLTAAAKRVLELPGTGAQPALSNTTQPSNFRAGSQARPKGRQARAPIGGFKAFVDALF